MDRIKIEIKNKSCFETSYLVTVADINYGGHVSNDAILRIVHEARIRFLEKNSMSELNIGGYGLIMIDAAIQYLAEAFRGEMITIQISVGEITKSGFELFYELVSDKNNKIVAKVKTGLMFFDYERRKICSVPEEIVRILQEAGN